MFNICIYTYMYIHVDLYNGMYMYVFIYVCVCIHVHVDISLCLLTFVGLKFVLCGVCVLLLDFICLYFGCGEFLSIFQFMFLF